MASRKKHSPKSASVLPSNTAVAQKHVEHDCPPTDVFDLSSSPVLQEALEPVWAVPLPPPLPPFEDYSLDRAASCVLLYLALESRSEWIHVAVGCSAYDGFLKAMDEDRGRTRTLPFSCWCDRGFHRHLVVVAPPAPHFETRVWNRIAGAASRTSGRCLDKRPVRSALDLVNTLVELGRRESVCEMFGDSPASRRRSIHFDITATMSPKFKIPLSMLWKGGLDQLARQAWSEKTRAEMTALPKTYVGDRWRTKLIDVIGRYGLRSPFHQHFVVCYYATPMFLHLTGERKMYFRCRDETLETVQ